MDANFGNCRLSTSERVLRCKEEIVPLPPKAVETLALLAARPGQFVSKQELLDGVWGDDCDAGETSLTQTIYRLRCAFKQVDPRVQIETLPRRGYRLITIEQPPEASKRDGAARRSTLLRDWRVWGTGVAAALVLTALAIFAYHQWPAGTAMPPSYRAGYYYWSRARTVADVRRSLTYFERATVEQRRSPLGYAGVADAHLSLALREVGSPEMMKDVNAAFAAARRAVALDPSSADAHAAFGQAHATFGDQAIAERELSRAVALDPDLVEARTWLGELLMNEGRIDAAAVQFRAALGRNPAWTEPGDMLALLAYLRRHYSDATSYAAQTFAQDPNDRLAAFVDALAEGQSGKRSSAENRLRNLARLPAMALGAHALLAFYYSLDGRAASSQVETAAVRALTRRDGLVGDPSSIISIAATLGVVHQPDAAFAWLARIGASGRRLFGSDARLDVLRADRRFKAWLRDG